MASLLDSVGATRAFALPVAASSASTMSSVSGRIIASARFPEFTGLKIRPIPVNRSSAAVSLGLSRRSEVRRGGRVVCEAQETTVDVPIVTDSTWQSMVMESDSPVLVEFSAPWCGPCRMIHPIVVELSKEYAGKFKFYKVNTDESPSITNQFGIRSIPTVMVFKNGEKKDAVIGAVPKTTLVTSIEKFL